MKRLVTSLGLLLSALVWMGVPRASAAEGARKAPFEYLAVKINVGDLDKTLAFYETFFGFKPAVRTNPSPTGMVQVYTTRGGENFRDGLTFVYEPGKPAPADRGALHTIVLSITDIMGTVKKLEAAGHKITRAPQSTDRYPSPLTSSVVIGYTVDPNGYPIEMVEWKP